MPEYHYNCDCGEHDIRNLPMSEASFRPTCSKCGKRMERDFVGEHGRAFHRPGLWPMASDALGVHPDQVQEAKEHAARHGISIDFDSEGRAILRSAQHKKDYAELHGFHDKSGGYTSAGRGGWRKYA